MPDYRQLRDMVSQRVAFEYDTGVRLVGYLAAVEPAEGPVFYAVLSNAELQDPTFRVLARFAELPLVPNNLVSMRVLEGASK